MFPVVLVSWDGLNFRPRSRRTAAKNLSIMHRVLPVQLIRPARALPTVVLRRPGPRVLLLGLLARKAPRRVRPVQAGLVARAAPDVQAVFPVLVVRAALVDLAVVLVVRPVRVALEVRPVVLAVPPAQA
jgi:hypothetical protein